MATEFGSYYAVIMAGGSGTRLWPLSRQVRPKQMLSLFDERTLFQTSVNRLFGLFPPENILVVTLAEQANELRSQVPELPDENFIYEPVPRGTAPVIGLAAEVIQKRNSDATMAVLTADHFIGNETLFRELLSTAFFVAEKKFLVTLGIKPSYPATGFGYIQLGENLGSYKDHVVYRVNSFKEKPTEEIASQFISEKNYLWNSGMFIWKVTRILDEFEKQLPVLANDLTEIGISYGTSTGKTTLDRIWPKIRTESIDYGIMESVENVVVIPAENLEWNDVGSWDSLFDVIPGDKNGNIVIGGEHIGLDTHQSLVYMNQKHRLIVTIGVDDLILVDTGDVLLVCRKDQAQRVRQVVSQLKQNGQEYI